MKLLFLTMVKINSIDDRGIYSDLLRKFVKEGHEVFIVSPSERREKKKTFLQLEEKVTILNIKTLNLQKTNLIEKGLGTLAMEYQYLKGIKKYFPNITFDLVLYSTPPITFSKVISYVKKRDKALSYLLLKDIFPQNAVDMQMIKNNGLLHRMFLKKEKKLYQVSDYIGCMSDANKTYLLHHNPEILILKVEVNPNSIEPVIFKDDTDLKNKIRAQFKIPIDKKVFIYGGNLGIPQGIDFLIETIASSAIVANAFFVVIGTGTEFKKLRNWFEANKPTNAILLEGLPKKEYDLLLQACDVGLLFLNPNFTIPNFPSRLLSYLENKMPVLAATDQNTDIGIVIEKANCGYWVTSGDLKSMIQKIELFLSDENVFQKMRDNALKLLNDKYDVSVSYDLIINKIQNV